MGFDTPPGLPPPAVLSNMLATLIDNQIPTDFYGGRISRYYVLAGLSISVPWNYLHQ